MTAILTSMAELGLLLLVEDNDDLAVAMARRLRRAGYAVMLCAAVNEATAALATRPEYVVLDVVLPDGSGVDVARAALATTPLPHVVGLTGLASSKEVFELGRVGVQQFVRKPFEFEELLRALQAEEPDTSTFVHAARRLVGHRGMAEVEQDVRQEMAHEAVARTNGSQRGAAKLLRVSHQTLARILEEGDDVE